MEALDNAWYGPRKLLTDLAQTIQACHLCTFNVPAIFWGGHPYIWRTTVRHDDIKNEVYINKFHMNKGYSTQPSEIVWLMIL